MNYGYHGRVLHADLTRGSLEIEQPNETFYRMYFGGSAFGAYYVLRGMPAHVDPLGEDNVLVLALSVLTGAPVSGQSRMTATAKSPLTGCIGDSQCGGFWPAELKFAGFDAIVVRGTADRPVYLWLHNGQAELRDAGHLWGMATGQAEASIRDELGDAKIEVLQVGPAGENQVRYASLMNMCNRSNGRTGMGAVMGSKNLKAIAVRGDIKPKFADAQAVSRIGRAGADRFPHAPAAALKYGTSVGLPSQQAVGGLPSYNWNRGVIDGADAISGQTMYDTILRGASQRRQDRLGRDTCFACIARCKRVVEGRYGPYMLEPLYGGPEYETLGMLGTCCGITDLKAVAYGNQLCNMYGLDTISCGGTIAWAIECFENGLITSEDTDGVELQFGDAAAMIQMVKMIALRKGFGDLLAEGSARAADILGKGHEFLVVVKGMELPAHMPQVKRGLGMIYAVNPFGPDHQSHEHDPSYERAGFAGNAERLATLGLNKPLEPMSLDRDKVHYAAVTQRLFSFLDSANLCQFMWGASWQLYTTLEMVDLVKAVTGWEVSLEELLDVGERRINMLRAFNAREGVGREADKLPERFFDRPLTGGPTDGWTLNREQYAEALDSYYREMGWERASGYPTKHKLEELDLDWLLDDPELRKVPAN